MDREPPPEDRDLEARLQRRSIAYTDEMCSGRALEFGAGFLE
jgi:hypothetical protein